MKFAIIADIHANLDAFQVVLEDCKKQQVTHYACLGDVVGYNANPKECLDIVQKHGGTAVAVAVMVDRSTGLAKFPVPTYSLLTMSYPTYPADQLPPELAALPASKPGS